MGASREIDIEGLAARISGLPGFEELRAAAVDAADAYVVGGAVRDALLGSGRADLDVVVEGDPAPIARALGGELRAHDRFGTFVVELPATRIDLARSRAETYAHPGALPEVSPAPIESDLRRRDFSLNAVAVAVDDPGRPIDPLGGVADLGAGLLRALHERSFADDPTRALRAARYASRLCLTVEPQTLSWLRATDLATVSADRVDAELRRLAREPRPAEAFGLLDEWDLLTLPENAAERITAIAALARSPRWGALVAVEDAVLAAATGPPSPVAIRLAALEPASASEVVEAGRGVDPRDLALARVLGAAWLDSYVGGLRDVALEISGDDLTAAGIPEGPAVGRGLRAALRAKLDGEAPDRAAELTVALDEARAGQSPAAD
jgi:tRNA nucleotidyltransferase (CCA-adding enzyme)